MLDKGFPKPIGKRYLKNKRVNLLLVSVDVITAIHIHSTEVLIRFYIDIIIEI